MWNDYTWPPKKIGRTQEISTKDASNSRSKTSQNQLSMPNPPEHHVKFKAPPKEFPPEFWLFNGWNSKNLVTTQKLWTIDYQVCWYRSQIVDPQPVWKLRHKRVPKRPSKNWPTRSCAFNISLNHLYSVNQPTSMFLTQGQQHRLFTLGRQSSARHYSGIENLPDFDLATRSGWTASWSDRNDW